MGNETRQDKAISIGVMHELMRLFEEDFKQGDMSRDDVSAANMCIQGFCGGMRGYEVMFTDLKGLRHDQEQRVIRQQSDGIGWPLVGRFKMEGGAFGNHIVPIAGVTKSGLQPLKWGDRLIGALQDEGVTKGWAFCREDGRQAHCADYGETVFSKLEEIQNNRPDLIEQDCKVREEYGLQRSWRRGFASEAANQGVKETDINAQCRWQSEMKTGRMVFRSMADRYTDYRLNRSRLLKPSRAL